MSSTRSDFRVVGLTHKFCLAFEAAGGTPADLNALAEDEWGMRDILAVRRGLAEVTPRRFPAWRTITLGLHKSAEVYTEALEEAGYRVSDWARDVMSQSGFTVAPELAELALVRVTVRDLGFTEPTRLGEIYARAGERGLGLLPAEAGPALRLGYTDQPRGEWLVVAHEPISGSGGRPRLFRLVHDDAARWLDAPWGSPGRVWRPGDEFVFAG